jgi:toxin FitB
MGKVYIIDTNTVIYYLNASLPEKALNFIEEILNDTGSYISVITKIELLGWPAPTADEMQQLEDFVKDSSVLPLSDGIANTAITIRRKQKIKLPDAVIAATALEYGYTLISRNDDDFRKIPGLMYLNPFTDI